MDGGGGMALDTWIGTSLLALGSWLLALGSLTGTGTGTGTGWMESAAPVHRAAVGSVPCVAPLTRAVRPLRLIEYTSERDMEDGQRALDESKLDGAVVRVF